jgi:LysR family transcriptional regulator, transcription activator of glutamate synthase operon
VTVPAGFGFRSLFDELLATEGVVLGHVSFEIGDLATVEGLVGSGLGVAILPDQFAGVSGTIGIPLTAASAERVAGLTWRSDRPLSPAAGRFSDFVRLAGERGECRGRTGPRR